MAEQVILEFVSDTTKLKALADQLRVLGQISVDQYNEFIKVNQQAAQAIQGTTKAEQDLAKAAQQTTKDAKGTADAFKGLVTTILTGALETAAEDLQHLANNTKEVAKQTISAKQELKQLQAAINNEELSGKPLQDAIARAAELKDRIGDTSAAISALASDTAKVDAVVQGAQGIAAGFQLAQGAAALFGKENENLQKAFVKLQAIMAITTSLQQLQNLLQKENILVQYTANGLKRLSVLLSGQQAAATVAETVATEGATVATAELNTVMGLNPAYVVLAGVLALGAALVYFTSTSDDAKEAEKLLNETLAETLELNKQLQGEEDKLAQQRIDRLKAQGAAADKVRQIESDLDHKRADDARKNQENVSRQTGITIDNYQKTIDKLNDLLGKQQKLEKEIANGTDSGLNSSLIEAFKKQYDELKKKYDKFIEARDAADKAANDAFINDIKRSQDASKEKLQGEIINWEIRVTKAKEGTAEELRAEQGLITAKAALQIAELTNDSNYEANKTLILAEAYKDRADLQAKFNSDIAKQREKDLADAAKKRQDDLEKEYAAGQKRIDAYAEEQKLKTKIRYSETGDEEEYNRTLQSLTFQTLNAKLNAANNYKDSVKQANDDVLAIEAKTQGLIADEHIKTNTAITDSNDKAAQKEEENIKKLADLQKKEDEKLADKKKKDAEDLRNALFAGAQELSSAIFQIQSQYSNQAFQDELDRLDARKERELSNKNLTESQKAAIEKKYAKEAAEIKRKQFEADRDAKIIQAIINTALGITAALTAVPPNPILALQAGIVGAAQVAAIAAQPTPKFFAKGTRNIPQGMAVVGEQGPELMYMPGGGSIIPANDTKALLDKWSVPTVNIDNTVLGVAREQSAGINYNKLGDVIARGLRDNPQTRISIDKTGFSSHLVEKGRSVQSINNTYGN